MRGALDIKARKEQAERDELARQENERRRIEAERLWRIEKGRRDRLDRLVAAWEHSGAVRSFVDRYRTAIGDVLETGELSQWLEWLDARAQANDPIGRISRGRILTLYHPTYSFNADRILRGGFTDESDGPALDKDHPPGVFLTDRQQDGYLITLIEVRLPEEEVLIYEWPDAGSAARNFYVPADLVNRLCRATPNGPPET